MNQKITAGIKYLRTNVTPTTAVFIGLTILVAGSVYAVQNANSRTSTPPASTATDAAAGVDAEDARVAVIGSESPLDATPLGNSWPGEVVSYGNVPVQPGREGTIVEWRVKIGERVGTGQVLARLSAPPAMPELVQMLAEQAEGRARMRAQATTTKRFTEANNEQLRTLLRTAETTTNESQAILTGKNSQPGTASAALGQARDAAAVMRKNLRAMIDQMLAKHMTIVSNVYIATAFQFGSLNRRYGAGDAQNQWVYEERFMQLVREFKNPEALPLDIATGYFASFTRLANTSLGGELGELMDIRGMAQEDQEKFLAMLAAYRDAEAEVSMKETEYALMAAEKKNEYAEQKREVEEKIAENEKMRAMAEAEAIAADAAYATVERSINGGLAIVAPRSGIISTINKKVGDFVEPGMPVASLDTERASERFVRLQIPNNVRTPKAGTVLSVVRPGFSQDVQQVKLTGVGTSLDTTGAYMADASFLTPVDWPVAASVRVLVGKQGTVPLIKFSSVWRDAGGTSRVWGVSEAGRIFARKITLGRTLGALVEVYEGLKNGDRYVVAPTPDLREDMVLPDAATADGAVDQPTPPGGHKNMPGM